MSIRKMSEVWDLNLAHGPKLVLLSLADQANDAGVCWPAVSTIARRCGYSDRNLRYILDELEQQGLISRQAREGRATMYTVTPAIVAALPLQPLQPTPATIAAHPGNGCSPPLQPLQDTPATIAARTQREPSKEPTEEPRGARARRAIGMPEGFNSEALALWEDWLTTKGKPVNDISRPLIAAQLVTFGDAARQLEVVQHSIRRQWVSLHAPREDSPPPGAVVPRERRKSADELVREARARGEVVDEFG